MKSTNINVINKGIPEKEYLWLKALDDANLGDSLVGDNSYTSEGDLSNKHPHVFIFPSYQVKKGGYRSLHKAKTA